MMSTLSLNATMNPFEAHAEALHVNRGRDRRLAKLTSGKAPKVLSPAEKAVRATQNEFAAYEKTINQERKALRETGRFNEILAILKQLDPDSAPALIACVQAVDWQ